MRVLVWGINYAPEQTGIAPYNTALCEHLRAHGHDARMLTTFAYYPAWKKQPGDRGRLFRTDVIEGVPVHRCWHYVPAKVSSLKRILHEGTFVTLSALRLFFLPRADVLVVVSPPLLLGAAAWFVTRFKRMPSLFHVQDLQPDAAAGLGLLKDGWFMRSLYWLEAFAYRKAARVGGIMPGMLAAFRQKGVPESKLVYFPNGAHLLAPEDLPAPGAFRQRNGFRPDDFLVVYSGNLGVKQGLDILLDAAGLVTNPRVQFVICGEGARRDVLARRIATERLPNVRLLPLQPEREYHELLVDADLCVITQQRGSGKFFFPSKLLTTLAFARPVLSVADAESELARAIRQGRFGANVGPGEPTALARAIEELAGDPSARQQAGQAGREYVRQFEAGTVLREFERVLIEIAASSERPSAVPDPGSAPVK